MPIIERAADPKLARLAQHLRWRDAVRQHDLQLNSADLYPLFSGSRVRPGVEGAKQSRHRGHDLEFDKVFAEGPCDFGDLFSFSAGVEQRGGQTIRICVCAKQRPGGAIEIRDNEHGLIEHYFLVGEDF